MDIADQAITILGAQRSGFSLAKLVKRLKGKPRISDISRRENIGKDFLKWLEVNAFEHEFGDHTKEFIQRSDMVILSPGVSIKSEPVSWAIEHDIPVFGEIEFSYQFCTKPIIAVTGSNGKTTVSILIDKILKEAGYKSCLCGNVGWPFSDYCLNSNDKDYVVLEVSSFQLESLMDEKRKSSNVRFSWKGFKPFVAVFLNLSENHLDRHEDLAEYFKAKKKIFLNQDSHDYAVLNGQDQWTRRLSSDINSQIVYFNESHERFYNLNHSAVLTVGKILNIDERICQKVFRDFKGVEHRLEWIDQIEGIDFVNDSKSTTVEASRWALSQIDQPIMMICGGRDKNIDFTLLSDLIKEKVQKIFVIGEAKDKIRQAFDQVTKVEECDELENAVYKARKEAHKGDCVILSPMCTSFDMFKDFEERGRQFKEIVDKLR